MVFSWKLYFEEGRYNLSQFMLMFHLLYGLEAAPLKKSEEKKMDVAEMRMLRWMVGAPEEIKLGMNI